MRVPDVEWLYFIADAQNRTIEWNGKIPVKNSVPTPIPQHPDGWKDIELNFGTSDKYWNLARAFSIPLKFVNDAASILRWYKYKGRGYEEDLYIIVLRWDNANGVYGLQYRGKFDMTTQKDNPVTGFTINTVEGGVLSYLNANDGVTYQIPCDETNPDIIRVKFDGVNLYDKFNYQVIDVEAADPSFALAIAVTIPIVFLNNEGDNYGIIKGGQDLDYIYTGNNPYDMEPAVNSYVTNSANNVFSSITPVSVDVASILKFINNKFSIYYKVYAITSKGTQYVFFEDHGSPQYDSTQISVDVNATINLDANESLFFILLSYGASPATPGQATFVASDLTISFSSRNQPSVSYCLRPLHMWQQLVAKMSDGKYTGDSNYFRAHNNLALTCGDALRNADRAVVPNYFMATTIADFFANFDAIKCMGLKVVNDVLFIEPRTDLYGDNTQIFDLGTVNNVEITDAVQYLINNIETGGPDQDYSSSAGGSHENGKYEFNGTSEWKLPVTAVNKKQSNITKYRIDCYGIEFIRSNLTKLDTTDNSGDKSIFVVNISDEQSFVYIGSITGDKAEIGEQAIAFDDVSGDTFTANDQKNTFTHVGGLEKISIYARITVESSDGNYQADIMFQKGNPLFPGYYSIASAVIDDISGTRQFELRLDTMISVNDSLQLRIKPLGDANIHYTVHNTSVAFTTTGFTLKRLNYNSITGVKDNTVFNIEELTPARQLRAWGPYLRGILYQLPGEKITFQNNAKNQYLSTTLNGVTITERASVNVSDLGDPLFLPYFIEFETIVPYAFAAILAQFPKGRIKLNFQNVDIYCLPVGNMTSKPATQDSQKWKLLIHPSTSLASLLLLAGGGTFIKDYDNNMLYISPLSPVHFVKYDEDLPAGFHTADMYDDLVQQRNDRMLDQPYYLQKWEKSDTIRLQFVTAGLGALSMVVNDKNANRYQTYAATIIADPAVQSPYTLQQFQIPLADYDDGFYQLILYVDGVALALSEWQHVAFEHPKTLLYTYYNSTNKLDAFFTAWKPSIRCEGMLMAEMPDGTFTSFTDEPDDVELINGIPTSKRNLRIGNGEGLPDFMAMKINAILLLNRTFIEGTRYSRSTDSKLEPNKIADGYPFYWYMVEIKRAKNDLGLTIDNIDLPPNQSRMWFTLDATAFGQAPGTIQISLKDE